jgi:sugar phosphate isomerase/epimerase
MNKPIKLAGAAWSWIGATLAESAAIYRSLGVNAIDLIAIPGKPLDTYQIAADPQEHADQVRALGVEVSNLLVFFGIDFCDRALNSSDPAIRQNNFETFERVLDFCVAAKCYSVTVLPGVEQEGHSKESALESTAAELNRMNKLAKEKGILLVYEPHVNSILEKPDDILTFVRQYSDVKLVIDYSHAVSLGHAEFELAPLVQYAGHVHLRQAKPGKIQARWDEGTIDIPALLRLLQQTAYRGYVTLEYEHDKFWEMDQCDVMTETIKMRNAVLPHLSPTPGCPMDRQAGAGIA